MQRSDTCPIEIPNFRILRLLGRGGMGRVFLAEQQQPRRQVVVKLVEPETIRISDTNIRQRVIERLQHEGDIAARFAHPNLVTVFQCGVINGYYFLAMEYLAGGDLRQRLVDEVGAPEAAAVAAKIASALAAMHRAGLLHRDLKPENILLRENGEPVLADFGIARDPDHPSGLTDLGVRSGTVHYMSPEHLSRGMMDARSDLYALGIVFFEMLTGRVPYDAATSSEIQQAHLDSPVPRLADDLARFQPIIDALLAKNPADRFQTAEEAAAALLLHAPTEPSIAVRIPSRHSGFDHRLRWRKHWTLPLAASVALALTLAAGWMLGGAGSSAPTPPAAPGQAPRSASLGSVAVLPFVNLSANPDNEYISDGISEEVLNTLAQLNSLRVAARTSSFQFKGRNVDVAEIGRSLGVRHVLEGSIRIQNQRIRVTAQLIETETGFHRWSATFDREMMDLFALQYDIARAVAEAIEPRLLGDLRPGVKTNTIEAYDLYLLGRHYFLKRNGEALQRARELFQSAAQADPRYALAYVGLANATILLLDSSSTYGDLSLEQVNVEASAALDQAQRLAPNLAEVQASQGLLQIVNGNHTLAVDYLSRALAVRSNLAVAYMWRGTTYGFLAQFDRCLADLKVAREIDRLSAAVLSNLIWANHLAGEPEITEAYIEEALSQFPEFLLAWGNAGNVRYMQGRLEEARLLYLHAYDASPSYRLARRMLGIIALDRGEIGRATELLTGADLAWPLLAKGRLQEAWPLARDDLLGDLDTRLYVAASNQQYDFVTGQLDDLDDSEHRLPGAMVNGSALSNLGRLPALTLAHALQQTGQTDRAGKVLEQAAQVIARARAAGARTPGLNYAAAALEALRGGQDAALDELEAAIDSGWKSWWYLAHDPRLETLHGAGRWQELLARIRPTVVVGSAAAQIGPSN